MKIKEFIVVLILFLVTPVLGQNSNIPGTPLIKNFSEESINFSSKIFDISQGDEGELYFATPGALLVYDGVRWENYSLGLESDLRAVLYVNDNYIYSSGHGGFGYWSKDETGVLKYTSLFFKEPSKQEPLLPVFWKIKEINGKILFQTFQQIFIYDPLKNNLEVIVASKGYNLLFESKNRVFIQDAGLGLFEIIGKDQISVNGTEQAQIHIIGVSVINDKELLIFTKEQGVWTWRDNQVSKNNWKINKDFENYLINDVREHQSGKYIVGTRRNGIYLITSQGKPLLHLDKSHGLYNNTVNTVFSDVNNNIWLGLENGITYLQVNSNTNYLVDTKGGFGTVYTNYLENTTLYLGTSQGLFYKDILDSYSQPKLIDAGLENIYEIARIDNQLLVGSHNGVFALEQNKIKTIHKEGGAWVFKKHPKIEDLMYVGFYSGIGVFKSVDGKWEFDKMFEGYGESSRFIEFDKYGQIWVSHPTKGYYRLHLSDDGLDLKEVEFYGVSNPFVETYAYICKIDDDLVFYNPKGFFNYDAIDNSFIKTKYPSEIFKDVSGLNYISQYDDIFWYSSQKSLGYIIREGNQFKNIREPFYSVRDKHLNDFNKFSVLNDSIFGIGVENGMVFHKIELNNNIENDKPIFKSLKLIGTKDTINASINEDLKLEIPYKNKYLKVEFALPKSPLGNTKQVQYKLDGLDGEWSDWNYLSELNFPGLASGNYTLELRTRSENAGESNILKKEFYVKYPWYFSKIAFLIYFLLFVVINVLYSYFFKKHNKKKIKLIQDKEQEERDRQNKKFELEKLESEKQLLMLKEENLQLEINKKNSELAYSTLNNVKKNELLHDLIKEIKEIDKNVLNNSLHSPIKKLIKKINNHLVDKEDWLAFELHFRNAHAQFFDNLREKHPNLSSNDIKLSAYLKLNLSSKEIASLMNIAISSVEQGRYRLRKKLELDSEISLVNYIQNI